ncbi:hypothetical protein [Pseudomonas sp. NCCP-436]|uniref:hypothetical protein n=1 Tax=Pseudomonas sp. NCCP-436 TaxID=2842481 RepID=UPI001C8042E1|nr:hypothetical protein [Pseudomonas sp. NCCP-436]GIZ11221.1 hypothetical protein NCCP436_06370 [Pseudomonas sp. NCCP-436]
MRIDGFLPPYSPDRGPRSGTAVTPYREAQHEAEVRQEQPVAPAVSQGLEPVAQIRRVQPGQPGTDSLPSSVRSGQLLYDAVPGSRTTQALASYSATAAYGQDYDAQEVLGLDLYA